MILALGVFNVIQPRWSIGGTDIGDRVTSMSTLPDTGVQGRETEASSMDAGTGELAKDQQEK